MDTNLNTSSIKLTFVSDSHEQESKLGILPACFLICHTGDAVNRGQITKIIAFLNWFAKQPANYKIWVPGNHERQGFKKHTETIRGMCADRGIVLLLDEMFIIPEPYISIFGSPLLLPKTDPNYGTYPHLPTFPVDILLTHEPAYRILDKVDREPRIDEDASGHIGSKRLLQWTQQVGCSIHAAGHLHEARGVQFHQNSPPNLPGRYNTLAINSCVVRRDDNLLVHKPIDITLSIREGHIEWNKAPIIL